jgi:sec-independent protein translocase protein TatC
MGDSPYPPYYENLPSSETSSSSASEAPWTTLLQERWEAASPHLEELRGRLLWVLGTWVTLFTGLFATSTQWGSWLLKHRPHHTPLVQLFPGEWLLASIKLSLCLAAVLGLPVALYHTLRYVLPGLVAGEVRLLVGLLVGVAACGLFGLWIALAVLLPMTLEWLLQYGQSIAPYQLSVSRYIEFILFFVGSLLLACQGPVVMVLLGRFGLLKRRHLQAYWRQTLLILVVLGAVFTPGQDPFSMLLLAGVLAVLTLIGFLWLPA